MAARRRSHSTRDLPPNLYVRNDGYYSFRDPRTGKEYGLGRDKRYAVNQAVEANMSMIGSMPSPGLLARIEGVTQLSIGEWMPEYLKLVELRGVKPKTLSDYVRMGKTVTSSLGEASITGADTRMLVKFLSRWRDEGKTTMYNHLRSFLRDFFSTGIAEGVAKENPMEHIKSGRVEITRERLTFAVLEEICKEAARLNDWAKPCIELALLTAQRRSDIFAMMWQHIPNKRLHITQQKTGSKIAIDTATGLNTLGKTISVVLEELKALRTSTDRTWLSVLPISNLALITNTFAAARNATGIEWSGTPPSFHEIRSLSARLYEKEKGKDFAQKILGHKNTQMTDKYIDNRGSDWVEV